MAGHLSAHGLAKSYCKGKNEVPVLRGVDLDVERGEMVAVVGASGSGKSTLLAPPRACSTRPTRARSCSTASGSTTARRRQRDELRNRTFGFIFQFYHLLPELTALENVLMPQLIRHGLWSYWRERGRLRHEGEELLERVGLGHRLDPSAVRALRRRDAARGDRPGAGRPARGLAGRRADRQPRRRQRPGRARTAPRLEPRARAHYDLGDARSADRPAGRPGRSARRRANRGMVSRAGLILSDRRAGPDRRLSAATAAGGPRRSSPKVYISGKLFDKSDAKISVFDHGLLYGDGVFEGIRAYSGRVFRLKQHVDRLYESAQGDSPRDPDRHGRRWPAAIVETLAFNKLSDAYIRVVVTRGAGSLGLDPRKTTDPQIIIITDRISLYPEELYEHGLKIITAGDHAQPPQRRQPADQVAQLPEQHPRQDRGDQRRLPRSPDAQPQGRGRRVHRRQHLRRAAAARSTRPRSTRASSRGSPATP